MKPSRTNGSTPIPAPAPLPEQSIAFSQTPPKVKPKWRIRIVTRDAFGNYPPVAPDAIRIVRRKFRFHTRAGINALGAPLT